MRGTRAIWMMCAVGIATFLVLPALASAMGPPEGSDFQQGPSDQEDMDKMQDMEQERVGMEDKPNDGKGMDLFVGIHGFDLGVHAFKEGTARHFSLQFGAYNSMGFRARFIEVEGDSVRQFGFGVQFDQIIEFRDANGNGYLDEGDEVVGNYPLQLRQAEPSDDLNGSLPLYRPLVANYRHMESPEGEKIVHMIGTSTQDGVFKIGIFIVEGKVRFEDGVRVHPLEIKMDFIIENYPYLENDTKLALNLLVQRRAPAIENGTVPGGEEVQVEREEHTYDEELGMAEGEEGLRLQHAERERNRFRGFFTWTKRVMVDGVPANVTASPLRQTIRNGTLVDEVSLAYPRGDVIVHDPKIGVSAYEEFEEMWGSLSSRVFPEGSVTLFALGLVSAAVVVVAAYYSKKEKHNLQK